MIFFTQSVQLTAAVIALIILIFSYQVNIFTLICPLSSL